MRDPSSRVAPAPTALPPAVWAEVHAHHAVMRYRRSGAGPPVLVLAPDDPVARWPALVAALVARHRVIVPEPPAGAASDDWLDGFVEGLGCRRLALVVTAPFAARALALALDDPDGVSPVVLVGAGLPAELAGRVRAAALPVLVVADGHAAGAAVPRIERFLTGRGGAEGGTAALEGGAVH